MGGGLMQLVAYGAQDIYLTGNPQITFFKVVYRRHTNFAMEAIEQTWDGNALGTGASRCTATISRNGDLVGRMYLEIDGTPDVSPGPSPPLKTQANLNAASITSIKIEIGGQQVDKHSGQWLNVWSLLTEPNPNGHVGECDGTDKKGTQFQNMSGLGGSLAVTVGAMKTFVPLQFWFCRNPGLALPLIALQYHEVKIILEHTFSGGYTSVTSNKLWCEYIFLDTDERRRFAQVSHEYLIEQLQEQSITPGTNSYLYFNHPVKELIFTVDATAGQLTAIGSGSDTYQLKLNGNDRFAARDWRYFTRTQIWQYHSGGGGLLSAARTQGKFNDSIGVYSFALKPEEHQPSGTCNFSRIDNAQLIVSSGANANRIYAVNYNVLRIMSGMGGLAYSN